MKITSGIYKYRKIEVPRGIRPTTEKVREAVFSMISQWIPDADVLDLFAGSGAMGLEALSRGAAHCTFVESSGQNRRVLAANIQNCGAGGTSTVIGRDYTAAINEIAGRRKEGECFDIVIIDPPYEMLSYYDTAIGMLMEQGLLDSRTIVICEHLYDNKLPDTYSNLVKIKEKKYGTIGIDAFTIL